MKKTYQRFIANRVKINKLAQIERFEKREADEQWRKRIAAESAERQRINAA